MNVTEYEALKAENARLRARNASLYKDCVAFAKLVKAGGKKDERIEELLEEITVLKAQVEGLKRNQSPYNSFADTESFAPIGSEEPVDNTIDNTVVYNPKVHYVDEQTFAEQNFEDVNSDSAPVIDNTKEDSVKKKSKNDKKEKKEKQKGSGVRTFFKAFFCIIFILSLLVSITSGVSYLFCKPFKDYTLNGYRFFTVLNTAESPNVKIGDAVLVKYSGFDGIALDSLVLTTKNTRSVAKITGLSVSGKESIAIVTDNSGKYEVSEKQFIGKVKFKIPYVGNIVRYASNNPYNYLAIIGSTTLLSFAIFLLIPSKKEKPLRFGKDYSVEDFTI